MSTRKANKMSVVSTIVLEGNQQIKAKKAMRVMRSSLNKALEVSDAAVLMPEESDVGEGEKLAVPDEYVLPDRVKKLFKPYRGDLFSSSALAAHSPGN
jgi:hypothetical protein